MRPALSVVIFTTLAGLAQGLVVTLALARLIGIPVGADCVSHSLLAAILLAVVGLAASFGHLGHPERAWRAVLMWRTSWLSREVIVLPAFILVTLLWWLAVQRGFDILILPLLALLLAVLLWICTAMIYACLRFIQEWAQPLTVVNFILIGLSSGLLAGCALATLHGEAALVRIAGPAALLITLAAGLARWHTVQRNASLQPRSTLQSATGIQVPDLRQKSMGMSAGSFNTREFFHGRSEATLQQVRTVFLVMGFVLPVLCAAWGVASGGSLAWVLAVLVQIPGLLAERWFFFAQAKHPQNLYYQTVS